MRLDLIQYFDSTHRLLSHGDQCFPNVPHPYNRSSPSSSRLPAMEVCASRGVESRNSFFATPDPGSPHAALAHMRPLSVLSPSHASGEVDDDLNQDEEANDTYTLSPDESARGLRQWRCWHTMHLPSADKPEPVRMLAITSLGGAGGGGGYLLACGLGNGTVEIWDCLTWACISTTPLSGTPSALLWRVGGVPGPPASAPLLPPSPLGPLSPLLSLSPVFSLLSFAPLSICFSLLSRPPPASRHPRPRLPHAARTRF